MLCTNCQMTLIIGQVMNCVGLIGVGARGYIILTVITIQVITNFHIVIVLVVLNFLIDCILHILSISDYTNPFHMWFSSYFLLPESLIIKLFVFVAGRSRTSDSFVAFIIQNCV